MKTTAFLKTNGWILLIGVSDDGEIIGVEADKFYSKHILLLFLTRDIKSKIGDLHKGDIDYNTESIDGKTIVRVYVQASSIPCYFSGKERDHFYIRAGPSTEGL